MVLLFRAVSPDKNFPLVDVVVPESFVPESLRDRGVQALLGMILGDGGIAPLLQPPRVGRGELALEHGTAEGGVGVNGAPPVGCQPVAWAARTCPGRGQNEPTR